jgi:hypothetical protein
VRALCASWSAASKHWVYPTAPPVACLQVTGCPTALVEVIDAQARAYRKVTWAVSKRLEQPASVPATGAQASAPAPCWGAGTADSASLHSGIDIQRPLCRPAGVVVKQAGSTQLRYRVVYTRKVASSKTTLLSGEASGCLLGTPHAMLRLHAPPPPTHAPCGPHNAQVPAPSSASAGYPVPASLASHSCPAVNCYRPQVIVVNPSATPLTIVDVTVTASQGSTAPADQGSDDAPAPTPDSAPGSTSVKARCPPAAPLGAKAVVPPGVASSVGGLVCRFEGLALPASENGGQVAEVDVSALVEVSLSFPLGWG